MPESVPCPICLRELDWDSLDPQVWDRAGQTWKPVHLPEQASRQQRWQAEQSAVVICPTSQGRHTHVLPLAYGRFGRPVIIGLVGRSQSGKTHLLSALIKALDERVDLHALGVQGCVPVDQQRHRAFMEQKVVPLFAQGRANPDTEEGVTSFADAFLMTTQRGTGRLSRVVAIFDVAGGDLAKVEGQQSFLYLVDALLFVADPTALDTREGLVTGDLAFGAVLDLLGQVGRTGDVAVSVALTKADRIRFAEPIDYWLRQPVSRDPRAVLAESRDVYAYLVSRRGQSWLRPFLEAGGRASMHVVSATGSSSVRVADGQIFPRGAHSQRVLGPFIALLDRVGVLAPLQPVRTH